MYPKPTQYATQIYEKSFIRVVVIVSNIFASDLHTNSKKYGTIYCHALAFLEVQKQLLTYFAANIYMEQSEQHLQLYNKLFFTEQQVSIYAAACD